MPPRRQGPHPLAYLVVALAVLVMLWLSMRQLRTRVVDAARDAGVSDARADAGAR
jgi:hypothetical protein